MKLNFPTKSEVQVLENSNINEKIEEIGFSSPLSIDTFEQLSNNLGICFFQTRIDGSVVYVNDQTIITTEFDSKEVFFQQNVSDLYKDKFQRDVFLKLLKDNGEVKCFDVDFITKSGKTKSIQLSAKLDGDIITGIAIDKTENKEARDTIENSQSIVRSILESTADGILIVGIEGGVKNFNQNFVTMWKIPEALTNTGDDGKLIKCVLDQLLHPENFIEKINYLYSNPEEESFDVLEFKDGRVFERELLSAKS